MLPALLAAKARRRADPRLERRLRDAARRRTRSRWCSPSCSATTAYRERVKIYATDIDEDALDAGAAGDLHRQGGRRRSRRSCASATSSAPTSALAFRKDLRRTVIFGRNNLVQDAPISRLDLLICRNTLMYFNAETQARILRHFHFALDDAGALMLGKSEMMITHRELFAASDLKQRIFVKQPRPTIAARRERVRADGGAAADGVSDEPRGARRRARARRRTPR